MPTIKFVRVERDCPRNKSLRAAGDNVGIIYDFDVLIDGEKRAQMRRDIHGRGYQVYDADGRPVGKGRYDGADVGSKAEFLNVASALLDAGLIPTLAQMAEKRAAEARAKAEAVAAKKEEQRQHAIRHHATALYDALKEIRDMAYASTTDRVQIAARMLKVVDGDAAAWMAAVDADPGRFNIY